jgi:hypothetical protein
VWHLLGVEQILLAYLVPLDVIVTGNITTKICEVWSEFNIFCTLVTMATTVILNFFNPPPKLPHEKHKNDHSRLLAKQKLMKLDRSNIHI